VKIRVTRGGALFLEFTSGAGDAVVIQRHSDTLRSFDSPIWIISNPRSWRDGCIRIPSRLAVSRAWHERSTRWSVTDHGVRPKDNGRDVEHTF
jgi:hypothetical protein